MARRAVMAVCGVGWLVLLAGVAAPLIGVAWAALQGGALPTAIIGVPPWYAVLQRSLVLCAVAGPGSLLLALGPGLILGSCRGRLVPVVLGLVLAPLLVPPQVHAYAWELAVVTWPLDSALSAENASRQIVAAYRAGSISSRWLWPIAALILAAGWRSVGRVSYSLALLDTSPTRALFRAALPTLRPAMVTAVGAVFLIALTEYGIPHLLSARVYATQLMTLCDAGAPGGQIARMAAQPSLITLVVLAVVAWMVRSTRNWQPADSEELTSRMAESLRFRARRSWLRPILWVAMTLALLITLVFPVAVMLSWLREPRAWVDAFVLLGGQWGWSLLASLLAAGFATALAVATVPAAMLGSRGKRRVAAWVAIVTAGMAALIPPALLGVGFVTIYNRAAFVAPVYQDTPLVWSLALAGRYGGVAMLVLYLAVGRRGVLAVEQARTDGADGVGVLAYVLLPMLWPSMAAAALIVTLLAMFEVVITHLVGPVGFPSVALALLGNMHWGRDDIVITSSVVIVVVGILATQLCGQLLVRREA